ncbi:MAG: hypothetical protein GY913_35320 [Proteobacteria bacterium]|nr:hypothetical protein [Pseudomonadota bacterium]
MVALPLALLAALGCNGGDEPLVEEFSGCDPTETELCYLPYPSTYHQVQDSSTASGWTLNFVDGSLPVNIDDVPVQGDYWNELDGYSTIAPLMTYFANLDDVGLPGHDDIEASLADDAPIVVLNAETGERVPYFAELDAVAEYDTQRLLIVRPVVPLDHATRYVVGIRDLSQRDGSPVEVSPAFAQLRDNTETDTWDVEGRREYFDTQIFPTLEAEGVDRSELQLAWDFVTVSEESSLGRVTWMRDDANDRFDAETPAYRITSVDEASCEDGASIGKTVYVEFDVPMYTETGKPGTFLTRDADNLPYYNGDTTAELMVRIPCSLIESGEPGMVLQYGHGLLGSMSEARTGYLSEMADRYGWIVLASDWVGMSEDDTGKITEMMVFDISDFAMLPERSLQGFVQKDLALRLTREVLVEDEEFMVDGVSLIGDTAGYYGNSQGAILGGGYVGMSQQLDRAVLGVGGSPYAILLSRSADFDPFFLLFTAKYDDQRDIAFLITHMQTVWDSAEAAGWLKQMNQIPQDGSPAKAVLQQVALGDAQVTTLGAHIMARAYQSNTIAPETRPIWGVEEAEAPFSGNAIVEWYYPDGPTEPYENLPPDKDLDTHECPRRELAAQDQLRDFLETGVVNQYCDGPCEGVREGFCD